jgi:hypothetical protein
MMTLAEYMTAIRAGLNNPAVLQPLGYCADDKDMGYRSGLRYLGIQQTEETDVIAQLMIYGEPRKQKPAKDDNQLFLQFTQLPA